MDAGKSPDWLPAGWTEQVEVKNGRDVKYYSNMETGQKFHSKNDVIRYVTMANICHDTPQGESKHKKRRSKNKTMPLEEKSKKTPEWLPQGWAVELRIRKSGSSIGRTYKCYIDPLTGTKFYSKPEVFEYLKTVKPNCCTSSQKEMDMPNNGESSGGETSLKQEEQWNLKTPHKMSSTSKKKKEGFSKQSPNTCESAGGENSLKQGGHENQKTPHKRSSASKKRQAGISKQSPGMCESTGGLTSLKQGEHRNLKTSCRMLSVPKKKQEGILRQSVVIERVPANGLPPGWIKEIKIEKKDDKIRKDPYYTDPVSGYVFDSQKEAQRYLETGDIKKCKRKPRKREELAFLNEVTLPDMDELAEGKTSLKQLGSPDIKTPKKRSRASKKKPVASNKPSVVIEQVTPSGLPPGWTKEIRIEKKARGIRKDPYYTDPVSGYVFRSQKDVLRYLETGDVNKCSIKPMKRDKLKFLDKEMSLSHNIGETMENKTFPEQEGPQNLIVQNDSRAHKKKQLGFGKQSVVIERVTPNGLPQGWIKEIRVERKAGRTRKDTYYTDPVSGYVFRSEKDALRYLETGDIDKCAMKPKKRNELQFLNGEISLRGAQNLETVEGMKSAPKQMKTDSGKQSVVIERVTPDGLPSGWIKEIKIQKMGSKTRKVAFYMDPASGYVFLSLKDALRFLETGDVKSCTRKPQKRDELKLLNEEPSPGVGELTGGETMLKQVGCQNLKTAKETTVASKQKRTGSSKQSMKKVSSMVVIERVAPDGLPSGWIKEIRIEKKANGIRRDPYYTDPVSGYVFRSQKDVLRYLETGDFSGCAIKPKKRAELGFLNEENYLPSAGNTQELGQHTAKRQLFSGTENGVTSSLETAEAEVPRRRQRKRVSADTDATSTPASDILERKHSVDSDNASNTLLPRTRGSKRKQSKVASAENGTITNSTEIIQEEKLAEGDTAKNSKREMQVGSRKSNKRRELSLPSRSSKRLTGVNPDVVVNLVLSELALSDTAEKSSESETKTSLEAVEDMAEKTQQFQPVSETVSKNHVSEDKEGLSEVKLSNNAEKSELDKPDQGQNVEGPQVPYSLGDSWSDPCLEFAFKTLTGAITVEDDIGIQGFPTDVSGLSADPDGPGNPATVPPVVADLTLSGQSVNPIAPENPVSVTLVGPGPPLSDVPEFGLPDFFQGGISSKSNAAANPAFLSPQPPSIPSWMSNAPQQVNLAEDQVNQAKANS
ncbi:hypothetical protein NMG60_11030427 [Bertholletia excelsa]